MRTGGRPRPRRKRYHKLIKLLDVVLVVVSLIQLHLHTNNTTTKALGFAIIHAMPPTRVWTFPAIIATEVARLCKALSLTGNRRAYGSSIFTFRH